MSTKLGVTENFVSSLYLLLIQSSTLKKCIEHCLTALATLLDIFYFFLFFYFFIASETHTKEKKLHRMNKVIKRKKCVILTNIKLDYSCANSTYYCT